MTGVLALIPGLPDGTWLVGLGLLILALNVVRLVIGSAAGLVRGQSSGREPSSQTRHHGRSAGSGLRAPADRVRLAVIVGQLNKEWTER